MTKLTRRDLFKRAGLAAVVPAAVAVTEFKHKPVTGSVWVTDEALENAGMPPSDPSLIKRDHHRRLHKMDIRLAETRENFRKLYSNG